MFIVDSERKTIINIDHAESIYTEDERCLIISTDVNRFSRFYGDKTKEVLHMIMDKIYKGINVIYLPTNDELEDHHEDTNTIVPDCCYFCETIPEATYGSIYHSDGQGYIASFIDNEYYLCSSVDDRDSNGNSQAIKIKFCPVCGRKL